MTGEKRKPPLKEMLNYVKGRHSKVEQIHVYCCKSTAYKFKMVLFE